MQYVQLYPISPTPIDFNKSGEIGNVTKISRIKTGGAGEMTISRHVIAGAPATEEIESAEHDLQIREEVDRRHYCRRVNSMHVIEELRSHVRRRHKNQRQQDITTVIDEMV
jgi:hypothetical protein